LEISGHGIHAEVQKKLIKAIALMVLYGEKGEI
jgi:hypothetical protein